MNSNARNYLNGIVWNILPQQTNVPSVESLNASRLQIIKNASLEMVFKNLKNVENPPITTYLVDGLDSVFCVEKDANLQMLLDHFKRTTYT